MPTYNAKSADQSVAKAAYIEAIKLTHDPVILLSLFETGMVESNFHNYKTATDHDSLGYLQQRPSQGWPNPTDIPTATKSYINKAIAKRKAHPTYSAGQLAQSVQVSAYPDRYNQAQTAALTLMKTVAPAGGTSFNPFGDGGFLDKLAHGITGLIPSPGDIVGGVTGAASGAFDGVANSIKDALAPLASVGKTAEWLGKLALPTNFLRLASGFAGALALLFGVYLLTREVRSR